MIDFEYEYRVHREVVATDKINYTTTIKWYVE